MIVPRSLIEQIQKDIDAELIKDWILYQKQYYRTELKNNPKVVIKYNINDQLLKDLIEEEFPQFLDIMNRIQLLK